MLLLIWLLVVVAVVYMNLRQVYSRFSRGGVRHLTPLPLLGNMSEVTFKQQHFAEVLERVYKAFPEDRFVGHYEFQSPVIVLKDLNLIKTLAVRDFEYFLDHRLTVDDECDTLIGRNLFMLKGQDWKDMRSTLSPAFTSSKIRLMVPFMVGIGKQMIQAIERKIKVSESNFIDIDSRDLMSRFANDVIASCAFGLKVDSYLDENNEFYYMGKKTVNMNFIRILKFLGYFAFPNVMKKFKAKIFPKEVTMFFRNLVTNTMDDREKRHVIRHDMIQLLMEAKKGRLTHEDKTIKDTDAGFATVEESELGKKQSNRVWSHDDLTAQVVIFFIAGFDSISTISMFLMYELAINPEVQEKLLQEIKEDWKKNEGKISYQSIQKMTYMDMVISEILRLWSAPMLDRICSEDYNLGKPNKDATEDYIIRKGESIFIPIWAIHRCPDYFEDPLKFDPERFSEQNKHKIKPFSYLPFGIGPRNCIGTRFALCELKIIVYMILLHVEVSLATRTRIPVQIVPDTFRLDIKGGNWIRLRSRNQKEAA